MATRAMLIRDAFMLPMEPLTVIPYMEQGKEDSSHHYKFYAFISSCMYVCGLSMCPFYIYELPNSVKS